MKWLLCIVFVCLAQVQARPSAHASMGPELECVEEKKLTLEQVLPYVHKFTEPEDKENIGDYLTCVWLKRKVIDAEGLVISENLARYLLDIYGSLNLSEVQKGLVQDESKKCKELEADQLSTLSVKVKNCMLAVRDSLDFLRLPKRN